MDNTTRHIKTKQKFHHGTIVSITEPLDKRKNDVTRKYKVIHCSKFFNVDNDGLYYTILEEVKESLQ